MLSFRLSLEEGRSLRILCLGAHADDIEIGCGGTILRLIEEVPDLTVQWIVFSGTGARKKEAEASASAFLEKVQGKQVDVHSHKISGVLDFLVRKRCGQPGAKGGSVTTDRPACSRSASRRRAPCRSSTVLKPL